MRKFIVSDNVNQSLEFNVGIAPGKFDTKQLILSAITVLATNAIGDVVRFVRTIERKELAKCRLFINDDFTTMFPVIPSYHDIEQTWDENCYKILKNMARYDESGIKIASESIKEKICNLESIDCLMELYECKYQNTDSFEDALNLTIKLIEKFISDSISEMMYFNTIKIYVERATGNYIDPPIYVQGWRSIVNNLDLAGKIQYAIFHEEKNIYRIESVDKNLILKKYIKGMEGVCYSGRFFIKVKDMEIALKVIERLPKYISTSNERFA